MPSRKLSIPFSVFKRKVFPFRHSRGNAIKDIIIREWAKIEWKKSVRHVGVFALVSKNTWE
uniref:Uncharacterized protein n=1 Tax=Lepeophtheirus salmonis TaxID=72036 RepID=A0A0K2U0I3_LEPSM